MNALAALFLFECHRDIAIGREANPVAFDIGNEFKRNEVMVAFMAALTAVLPGQLDTAAFDAVDRSNMDAIRADDFGVFLDSCSIDHGKSPFQRSDNA
jgi:hypothetical protein